MHINKTLVMFLAMAAFCNRSNADDWRQFRGPSSNGVKGSRKLPDEKRMGDIEFTDHKQWLGVPTN